MPQVLIGVVRYNHAHQGQYERIDVITDMYDNQGEPDDCLAIMCLGCMTSTLALYFDNDSSWEFFQ